MTDRDLIRRALKQHSGMDEALQALLYMCASDVRVVPMLRGYARRLTELEQTLLELSDRVE
jgi:hypothetical protein